MYRSNARVCPACRAPMSEVPCAQRPEGGAEGEAPKSVSIDICDHCGGIFFEFFDGEPVALAREVVERMLRERPPDRPLAADRRCPDCDEPMEQRPYLDLGPEVARCDACMGLFATPAQLLELASFRLAPEEEREEGWLHKLRALLAEWLDAS